jgi:hypothetical protein
LWRHQTGWIFSSGYGSSRLWTRAAPPPIRFARRRLQKICRSPSFEHVVPSAFVLKRRICDVIAPLPTRGVRKQKRHNSRNPTSQPVFDWLDFQSSRNPTSFRLVGFSSARNPTSFRDGARVWARARVVDAGITRVLREDFRVCPAGVARGDETHLPVSRCRRARREVADRRLNRNRPGASLGVRRASENTAGSRHTGSRFYVLLQVLYAGQGFTLKPRCRV